MRTLLRIISALAVVVLLWLRIQPLAAQTTPDAVVADPPADPAYPATMAWPDISSHVANHSVIYIASGAGPHPAVLMLHGFPGNEKNLDLAYSIRRAGWDVLVPFYRGAWGSGGTFSFMHALEDAHASIDFLSDSFRSRQCTKTPAVHVGKAISLICSLVSCFGGTPGGLQVSRKKPSRPAGDTTQSRRSS